MPDDDLDFDLDESPTLTDLLKEAAASQVGYDELMRRVREANKEPAEPEVHPSIQVIEALGYAQADAEYQARHGEAEDRQGYADLAEKIKARKEELAKDEEWLELADLTDDDVSTIRISRPDLADRVQLERRTAADARSIVEARELEVQRLAAMTEEERTKELAAAEMEAHAQEVEDSIQALMDQTDQALKDPGDYSVAQPVTLAPTDGGGFEVLSPKPMMTAKVYEPGYRRVAKDGVGLMGVKRLADELQEIPVPLRADWWSHRTDVEREILERGFGLRPPIGRDEIEESE